MTPRHADDDKTVMPDLIGHLIAKYLREILRLGYLFFVHKSDGFLDKVKRME